MTAGVDILDRSPGTRHIEAGAREFAASFGDDTYGSLHLLAVLVRADDVGGEVLRAYVDDLHGLDAEMSQRSKAAVRSDSAAVGPDDELAEIFDLLHRTVAGEGRVAADPVDLVRALTTVSGPHSRYMDGSEAAIRRQLDRAAAGRPLNLPGGRVRSVLSVLGSLITWFGLAAIVVFFGAGLVVHRGLLHTLAAFQHIRIHLPSLPSVAGPVRPNTVMRWRQFVWCALGPRLVLFMCSAAIFFALAVEIRGLGLSPFPALTAGALRPEGALDDVVGAQMILSRHPVPLWVAVGTGFFALPASEDVDRLVAWSHARAEDRASSAS